MARLTYVMYYNSIFKLQIIFDEIKFQQLITFYIMIFFRFTFQSSNSNSMKFNVLYKYFPHLKIENSNRKFEFMKICPPIY